MENVFQNTKLWIETLSDKSKYYKDYSENIDFLRIQYLSIREKVKEIASSINWDTQGLTIHDISHIDSLWDTASILLGANIPLNPIEGFIFGCCSLFHDLGLSLVCYESNIEDIQKSKEYKDILYKLVDNKEKESVVSNNFESISPDLTKLAFELKIRQIHAIKAVEIPKQSWNFKGNSIYLISDENIRKALGTKIGILASSHWWNISNLREEFGNNVLSSSPVDFPNEWKINNLLIACLLRLADFINIDYRRAPDLHFSYKELNDISKTHWTYQNKLNRPILDEDSIIFESLEPFDIDDIEAWWLAFNTINEIDNELKKVDELLFEYNQPRFIAKRVKGSGLPENLAVYIKTVNWNPINTQFKVSDINKLIERFGGQKLYGEKLYIPIRELIQNSIDAVNAKQHFENRFAGSVRVNYSKDKNTNDQFLTITDDGIGMSKSTIIDYLLDFGQSYWNSNNLPKDLPGLLSSGFKPCGTYGIGFYSTFMIAQYIKIITRPLKENMTYVLEFREGLNNPPIFRRPCESEVLYSSGTVISLKLKIDDYLNHVIQQLPFQPQEDDIDNPLKFILYRIAPAISVNLYCSVNSQEEELIIKADDWKLLDNYKLINRLTGIKIENTQEIRISSQFDSGSSINSKPTGSTGKSESILLAQCLSNVVDKDGNIIGRATIIPPTKIFMEYTKKVELSMKEEEQYLLKNKYEPLYYLYSGVLVVNGIWENLGFPAIGIWQAQNSKLDRQGAELKLNCEQLSSWIEEQSILLLENIELLESDRFLKAVSLLYAYQSKNTDLPLVMSSNGFITYKEFVEKIRNLDHCILYNNSEFNEYMKPKDNVFGVPGKYGNNYILGFRGHNKPIDHVLEAQSYYYSSFNSMDEKFNLSFLRKTIAAVCEAWQINFKEETIIDLIKESYINFEGGLINGEFLEETRLIEDKLETKKQKSKTPSKNKIEKGKKLREEYFKRIKKTRKITIEGALLINPKKTNREKIMEKYEGIYVPDLLEDTI